MAGELFIPSDYHKLTKVVVQSPGPESRHVQLFAPHIPLGGFTSDTIGEAASLQHTELTSLLRQDGSTVLYTHDLINSAINEAGPDVFDRFLEDKFPRLRMLSRRERQKLSANDLIGANDLTFYPRQPGREVFTTHPLQWMYYTRDFAVMLPHGVALTAFDDESRSPETSIVRFMFENAPELKEYPVIFDAEKEGVKMQGGDMIVLDPHTLLMGVGNLSSVEAAKKLAKRTNMDVLGIRLPAGPAHEDTESQGFTPLNLLFLHLDTVFNLVDNQRALVIPYFFQDEFEGVHPLSAILASIKLENLSPEDQAKVTRLEKVMDGVGKVTVYEAGTGEEQPTDQKLVNYLKDRGYSFAFAGGEPKATLQEQVQHLTEVAFPEIRFQGANILANSPGKVIMYKADTSESRRSLAELGVEVALFDGHELARWNGGPHCMTLPLERK